MSSRPYSADEPTVPCELCGTATTMLGTKRCDRCWELEGRIQGDPELARQILARLDATKGQPGVERVQNFEIADQLEEWAAVRDRVSVRRAKKREPPLDSALLREAAARLRMK